jgi:hypothetical protein
MVLGMTATRRLARRLFTLCWALSLMLCIFSTTMWARGRVVRDTVTWTRAGGSLTAVQSTGKRLQVCVVQGWHEHRPVTWARVPPLHRAHEQPVFDKFDTAARFMSALDVRLARGNGWFGGADQWGQGPLRPLVAFSVGWDSLTLASVALPGFAAMTHLATRRASSRRRAKGLCVHCGYDLRASPEQCPECGAVPTVTVTT